MSPNLHLRQQTLSPELLWVIFHYKSQPGTLNRLAAAVSEGVAPELLKFHLFLISCDHDLNCYTWQGRNQPSPSDPLSQSGAMETLALRLDRAVSKGVAPELLKILGERHSELNSSRLKSEKSIVVLRIQRQDF